MDMNENTTPDQNAGMTAEEADDWLNEKALADMAAEPATQEMIFTLQNEACIKLSAIIDETATLLMQGAEQSMKTQPSLVEQQSHRLRDSSTRRRQAWQKARELAEMLVIGALLNKDNPAWDPSDPSSCAAGGQSTLLSLIRFDLEEAGTLAPAG